MQLALQHLQQCFDTEHNYTEMNNQAKPEHIQQTVTRIWLWLKRSNLQLCFFPIVKLFVVVLDCCSSQVEALTITRVFSRTSSWVETCTAGHRILLGRSHVWGAVLQKQENKGINENSRLMPDKSIINHICMLTMILTSVLPDKCNYPFLDPLHFLYKCTT